MGGRKYIRFKIKLKEVKKKIFIGIWTESGSRWGN